MCSGTVADDGSTKDGRSIIITAAHCVYDDVNKAFARKVLFIPDQARTTGSRTDLNPWDYAFYVVSNTGAHYTEELLNADSAAVELKAGAQPVSFGAVTSGDYTGALGYSYSEDPNFVYCAEEVTTTGSANWWLASCGLSGGASGGPWLQPMSSGEGPIISVNSWGYTNSPGMAGPKLYKTSAECVFNAAKTSSLDLSTAAEGRQGAIFSGGCP